MLALITEMYGTGANLALLLLGGFQSLADAATVELAKRGHKDYRVIHDSAMRFIAAGADSASELGRRLRVTKQAAAKTISALEERGYVQREVNPGDARRMRVKVTPRGFQVLTLGEKIFNDLRKRWEEEIGATNIQKIEKNLTKLLTGRGLIDPGWLAQDQDSEP